ncbi:MAG: hypothetical protein V9G12_09930 [Microthrixaceae bacterium]
MKAVAKALGGLDAGVAAASVANCPPVRRQLEDAAIASGWRRAAGGPSLMMRPSRIKPMRVQRMRLVHVGRADQDGQVAAAQQRHDQPPEILARHRVNAGGRLVEQQHLGLVDQRQRQPQLLLHAAGKLAGAAVAEGRQPDELQNFLAARRPLRAGSPRTSAKKRRFSCTVSSS